MKFSKRECQLIIDMLNESITSKTDRAANLVIDKLNTQAKDNDHKVGKIAIYDNTKDYRHEGWK